MLAGELALARVDVAIVERSENQEFAALRPGRAATCLLRHELQCAPVAGEMHRAPVGAMEPAARRPVAGLDLGVGEPEGISVAHAEDHVLGAHPVDEVLRR